MLMAVTGSGPFLRETETIRGRRPGPDEDWGVVTASSCQHRNPWSYHFELIIDNMLAINDNNE